MFGKPQWFRPKRIGWGLVPVTWQGWLYSAGWVGAMVLPFLLLTGRNQPLEAAAWMTAAITALTYDVWQILRGYRSAAASSATAAGKTEDNVLYILDSQPGQSIATRNFNLHVRA
jgi:hypothetical protein